MGAGGRMSVGNSEEKVLRAPHARPPFTVGQLKKAVPPHCFNRSLWKSASYLALDLVVASALVYTTRFITYPGILGWALWCLYWMAQGCILTGVWVIAHECGHHAFSDYAFIDDTVGLVLHSWLLVPYFSWKYSHRRHHSNTGSLSRDEVFVPKTKESIGSMWVVYSNPVGRLLSITMTLTLGWPLYLMLNVSGRPYDRFASHFDPSGPIFNNRERLQVVISDASLMGVGICLYKSASAYGWAWLWKVYAVPLLIVNGFLVLITFLQHTHPALPHYSDAEWEWLRGALSTVDRDYGILNYVFHHITDTHVTHHIFTSMPHYHAGEATRAIKPILGNYYQFDSTPVVAALWREFKECIFVEADPSSEDGVFWYKSKPTSNRVRET